MGQPVKISDELLLDARMTAEWSERSIAGQIEFWAHLGRAVEPILGGDRAMALRRAAAVAPLSRLVETVDSADGRMRVAEYLQSRPFPHFEPAPCGGGYVIRIAEDGTRTLGRFVGREFKPVE